MEDYEEITLVRRVRIVEETVTLRRARPCAVVDATPDSELPAARYMRLTKVMPRTRKLLRAGGAS